VKRIPFKPFQTFQSFKSFGETVFQLFQQFQWFQTFVTIGTPGTTGTTSRMQGSAAKWLLDLVFEYYRLTGRHEETGRPYMDTLQRLGLDKFKQWSQLD